MRHIGAGILEESAIFRLPHSWH